MPEGTADTEGSVHQILLSIGGVIGRIDFIGMPSEFAHNLRDRYDPWCLPASPLVRETFLLQVNLQAIATDPESLQARREKPLHHPLVVVDTDTAIELDRWDLHARLDRASPRERHLWSGTATCEADVVNFDALIRILWSILLPRASGALFHACAVRVGQTSLLLPGQSGAGKSTFAAKMPEADDVLTDEVAAVIPDGHGSFRVCSTPFWGDFKRGGGSLRSWPLAGIVHLRKGEAFEVCPASTAETLQRLMGCLVYFGHDTPCVHRHFNIAAAVAQTVAGCFAVMQLKTPAVDLIAALAPTELGPFDIPDTLVNHRELISESRWLLRKHGQYAFGSRGGSMHPCIRDGEPIFAKAVPEAELRPGNVLLYWVPGPAADDDRLICHRLVFTHRYEGRRRYYAKGDTVSRIEQFEDHVEAEVLGKVTSFEEQSGLDDFIPGVSERRLKEVSRLLVSLGTSPLAKLMGR